MSDNPHSDPTLEFYERNARTFVERTLTVKMDGLYAEFVPLVPAGGKILDAGCGSGRDSAYFQKLGYRIAAFDASKEIAAQASAHIGQPVSVMSFNEVNFDREFDAVWACASLLHVPQADLDMALFRLIHSLKINGVFYASFKYGDSEGVRNGRFFNDFNEAKLDQLLSKHTQLRLLKSWKTTDARPDHKDELWLNWIGKRIS